MTGSDPKKLLEAIFRAALVAVDPYDAVVRHTGRIRTAFEQGNYRRLLVIAFGKAACPMAKALEEGLFELIAAGYVITKYGHCRYDFRTIRVCEAGHPLPDENGRRGTQEIMQLLRDADEKTLVACLISGGGSALLCSPWDGITLADKQTMTDLLLRVGADIQELNTVRKHISAVKGGRLAEIAYPAVILSLILSDVIGDRLDVIASGPVSPDHTTYRDALNVLDKYGLGESIPGSIREMLRNGVKGLAPETPKEGNPVFRETVNTIISNNRIALKAAKAVALSVGFDAEILAADVSGEARDCAKRLAEKAKEQKSRLNGRRPLCLISGGETTVSVRGNGLGGRNMELALAFAAEIEGSKGITLLSAGTDGTDGPTDAAGAIVDGDTIRNAWGAGIDPALYLTNNDSYHFFKKAGGLLITGPTGTNVMDVQLMLIG
ncbi:MAG: glycerate kinase [Deltaproteobacteria bacterium]|nr:glycerate kinase [Deltaproteobacteria bacterium]